MHFSSIIFLLEVAQIQMSKETDIFDLFTSHNFISSDCEAQNVFELCSGPSRAPFRSQYGRDSSLECLWTVKSLSLPFISLLLLERQDRLFFKCVPKSLDRMVLSLRDCEQKGKVATDNISSFDSRDIMYNVKENLDYVYVERYFWNV